MATDGRLPEGCPPTGSSLADGPFYRLTRTNARVGDTLDVSDFRLPLHTRKSAAFGRTDYCGGYAVSVCADMQDLINAREILGFARKKSISRLHLSTGMGRIMQTPGEVGPSHHDWWPSEDDFVPPHEVLVDGRSAA
ncbi:hypothetical protein [Xylanimonas sp. McL0601]|uniref:hypothetical protein n=1 Tax=Xylanimonas sp. McL0601 TaxID=3414739 RepID=UPI003CF1577C